MAGSVVNIDLSVADVLKLVGEILARRGQRKRDLVRDLVDDAEAAETVVKHLDRLFTDLLSEFARTRVTEDREQLADVVDEARKFLFQRELVPILDGRLAAINKAAEPDGKGAKLVGDLRPVLERLGQALKEYRANLDQAMDGAGTAPGNLSSVYRLARSRVNGSSESPAQIRELAERTLQEHDFSLSQRVYERIGELRQSVRV
jgi:hypothetical protein